MGEILGIGATHYPPGLVPDEYKPWPLARMLQTDPRIPAHLKDPANWPEPMRAEWGDDEGITSHKAHRARVFKAFRKIREEIDAFQPDFILIWGDDQYENFKEDIIPPFCVLAYDQLTFNRSSGCAAGPISGENRTTKSSPLLGIIRPGASSPADSWKKASTWRTPTGRCTRTGWVTPSPTRCCSWTLTARVSLSGPACGGELLRQFGDSQSRRGRAILREPDPPSPSPRRCFEVGQATARVLKESPWRVVLMASSSWSHAFLTEKNHWIYPDLEADRVMLEQLRAGDYTKWRDVPLAQMEASGQQEVLNWVCLAGAMAELDYKANILDWVETWTFNAPKCLAVFK